MAKQTANKGSKSKKVTPLMKQYAQIKSKYPDAILLFRVGDFYETFGDDAVKAAQILNIVLTKRNNGGDDVPLAGFPHHSADIYTHKIVRAGYRVAICEQLEKPSKEKKIVKRGIVEVITPGIAINDNLLDVRSNNFLASLHYGKRGQIGVAFLDISTGEFLISEGEEQYIDKLLQSLSPSEIIFSKSKTKDFEAKFGTKFYTFPIEEWVFMSDYAREKILEQFEVQSLKGFGVEDLELAQVAAGAILHYVATTENKNLKHIANISRIEPEKYVWLDRFTIRNLEMIYSAHETGTPLINILDNTVSPMGARLLKKWVVLPLKNRQPIQARLDMVEYFLANTALSQDIEYYVQQIGDIERLISKVPLGKINPREVVQLKKALHALVPIKKLLGESQNPHLQQLADRINLCTVIRDKIEQELVDEPPVNLAKGKVMSEGVSPELDELRDLIYNSKEHLVKIQRAEAERTGIDNLKIGFNNVFGYYLEVTNKYKNKGLVPDNWVRKQTLTNAERYITEELKTLESKILSAEEKIQVLEEQLFEALVATLNDYIAPVQLNGALVAQVDCLLSFAKVAHRNNYSKPTITDDLSIDIKQGRHPVIEQQLEIGQEYVPNDTFLDNESQQIMIITGPNMSGKSAILRQTALICLMAQMGSYVPAEAATLGLVDKVFTRVGASDNISSGESTFMVEMNETASIMNNVSERSLILLDEIGRGTSTYDGISIAWSIAEFLHDNGLARPKTLFATHYHELNELEEKFPRIKNYNVATKEIGQKVIFLRKLKAGGSHHSFGIHVAKMAGMPRSIVERASHILAQLETKSIDNEEIGDKVKRIEQQPAFQLSIFDTVDETAGKIKAELLDIDVNRLTPIECMLKLSELVKVVKEEE